MRIYKCRYVSREDFGDLLWGWQWRHAILVDECQHEGELFRGTSAEIEAGMVDADTGKPVGDTQNFCVDPTCMHKDCSPLTLIWEGEAREEVVVTDEMADKWQQLDSQLRHTRFYTDVNAYEYERERLRRWLLITR